MTMPAVTAEQSTTFTLSGGVQVRRLSRASGLVEFFEARYPQGSSTSAGVDVHAGVEYHYLLAGELEVAIGDATFILSAGEAATIPSTQPHLLTNCRPADAVTITVTVGRDDRFSTSELLEILDLADLGCSAVHVAATG